MPSTWTGGILYRQKRYVRPRGSFAGDGIGSSCLTIDQQHRRRSVQRSRARLDQPGALDAVAGQQQRQLDVGLGQPRPGLEQQRRRSRHHRRRHARPAHLDVGVVPFPAPQPLRVTGLQIRVVRRGADDLVARRYQFRLQHPVDVRQPPRAVGRHHVVTRRRRPLGVERADRDHRRHVAGADDPAEHRLAVLRLPEIARRGDDDEAGIDGALGRPGQRIGLVRLEHGLAEREIDDPDPVLRLVGDRKIDGVDDVAAVAGAVGPQDLERDDV